MKKKIIWGAVIILILGFVVWWDLPYIIKISNIISNQEMEYTYEGIYVTDFSLISDYDDYEDLKYFRFIDNEIEMKSIIDKIDSLQLRRTKKRGNGDKHLSFIASYSPKERVTYTEDVFSIYFEVSDKGENILIFGPKMYKDKYYRILNNDFDLEAFFKELMGEEI